jgi:hypothetical protein
MDTSGFSLPRPTRRTFLLERAAPTLIFRAVGLGTAAPASVTTAQLRAYVAALQERRLAPATVAKRVLVLKRFFGFLLQAGYLTTDPSRGLPRPKVGQRLPKTLTLAELGHLFAVMDDTTRLGRRDTVFFQLTYAGGYLLPAYATRVPPELAAPALNGGSNPRAGGGFGLEDGGSLLRRLGGGKGALRVVGKMESTGESM